MSLYELVTGTRPFKGDSDYSIMVAHLEQQPVPPLQVDPTLPSSLNEIIMTAIQKDAEQRFQSAQAFRAALESVKEGLIPPPNYKPRRLRLQPRRRQRRPSFRLKPPRRRPRPCRLRRPRPPPAVAKSHRGLWMGLGALVAVAVLAVAAIQVPKWYRTRAGSAPPPVVETPAQPVAEVPPPAAEPVSQPAAPAEPAAQPPLQAVVQPQPVAPRPAAVRTPRASAPANMTPPPQPAPSEPVQVQQQAAPQLPPQAVVPTVDPEALETAREKLGMLGTRANALIVALRNLQQQQQRMGVGMRTDITTSWKRMEFLLDESEAALKRQDLAGTKKNLDLAEREADKLDKFLGR